MDTLYLTPRAQPCHEPPCALAAHAAQPSQRYTVGFIYLLENATEVLYTSSAGDGILLQSQMPSPRNRVRVREKIM